MGFIDWTYWAFVYKGGNSNHTKIALLFYKNKFLLEFEIDTPCEVYHEHNEKWTHANKYIDSVNNIITSLITYVIINNTK